MACTREESGSVSMTSHSSPRPIRFCRRSSRTNCEPDAGAGRHHEIGIHGAGQTEEVRIRRTVGVQYNRGSVKPPTPCRDINKASVARRSCTTRTLDYAEVADPMITPAIPAGILLVGHGTAQQRGTRQFLTWLAELVAEQARAAARRAGLSGTGRADDSGGLRRLHRARAQAQSSSRRCCCLPPATRSETFPRPSRERSPTLGVTDRSCDPSWPTHLGCHAGDSRTVVALRFTEVVTGRPPVPARAKRACSSSAAAAATNRPRPRCTNSPACERLCTPVAETHVAFLAMAQPAVSDILPRLAARNWRRIVVQPHLCFTANSSTACWLKWRTSRRQHSVTEWIVTSYLACGFG